MDKGPGRLLKTRGGSIRRLGFGSRWSLRLHTSPASYTATHYIFHFRRVATKEGSRGLQPTDRERKGFVSRSDTGTRSTAV